MKRRIRVLLAEAGLTDGGSSAIKRALEAMEDVEVVAAVSSGVEAYRLMEKEAIDFVLMDLILSDMDGFGVLAKAKECLKTPPVFIICSVISHQLIIQDAMELGAAYYLPKTASGEWCARRSVEVYREMLEHSVVIGGVRIAESTVRRQITQLIGLIGVPPATKGYSYLRTALRMTLRDPEIIHCMTTKLYPAIAKADGSKPSSVERTIRCTIETTWNRGDIDVINALFGNTVCCEQGRPTNAEFIARLTDVLLMHMC